VFQRRVHLQRRTHHRNGCPQQSWHCMVYLNLQSLPTHYKRLRLPSSGKAQTRTTPEPRSLLVDDVRYSAQGQSRELSHSGRDQATGSDPSRMFSLASADGRNWPGAARPLCATNDQKRTFAEIRRSSELDPKQILRRSVLKARDGGGARSYPLSPHNHFAGA
jgi:hypothetical protein